MELLQLRYFLTAAEYQHITKAAEHLQIAQPALSQAIHRLEAELGVPLFERKSRSIELNDAGRFLQKRLIPIISSLDQLAAELQMGREQAIHTIRLRLLSASALITNRIIAFRSLRPDVNFQLYQTSDQSDDYDLCVSARRAEYSFFPGGTAHCDAGRRPLSCGSIPFSIRKPHFHTADRYERCRIYLSGRLKTHPSDYQQLFYGGWLYTQNCF